MWRISFLGHPTSCKFIALFDDKTLVLDETLVTTCPAALDCHEGWSTIEQLPVSTPDGSWN
jgi:disulfide bond formation protein DsbB